MRQTANPLTVGDWLGLQDRFDIARHRSAKRMWLMPNFFTSPTPRNATNDGLPAFVDNGDVLNSNPLFGTSAMSLPGLQQQGEARTAPAQSAQGRVPLPV